MEHFHTMTFNTFEYRFGQATPPFPDNGDRLYDQCLQGNINDLMGNVMSLLSNIAADACPKERAQVQIQDAAATCCSTVRESSSDSESNIKNDKAV